MSSNRIAVVSMAGRFPGAGSVEQFWSVLIERAELVTRFAPHELIALGRDPYRVGNPAFVGVEGVLVDIDGFDAEFFGYSPREAEVMDPQHRLCLEEAWNLFHHVGLDPVEYPGSVGVFLAASMSAYLVHNLLPDLKTRQGAGGFSTMIHNDKDYAAATLSYKLGLTGPSYAIGSACSSSLTAVHVACQSLLAGEVDAAVAGGVSVHVPHGEGYVHAADEIYSATGRCAPFRSGRDGTVGGSGVGLVLLKRLDDAVADGDPVHGVLLGSAVTNDGAGKMSFTAPGPAGQVGAIAEALAVAQVDPASIGYIESHGTGTLLGDEVEIGSLRKVFGPWSAGDRPVIGAVKGSIGHLDAAAGVAGLIKSVLVVREGVVPGSPHADSPAAGLEEKDAPFTLATDTVEWAHQAQPRRAGVSAFGIGGTNAHVVVEQPPAPERTDSSPWADDLRLSARSVDEVRRSAGDLAEYLRARPSVALDSVSATLAGRRCFGFRIAVPCADRDEVLSALEKVAGGADDGDVIHDVSGVDRSPVFLFPGQGGFANSTWVESALADEVFRRKVDECSETFAANGIDLQDALDTAVSACGESGENTALVQPVLFALSWAHAMCLIDRGVEPSAMLGHSMGEYVAATVAGVFSFDDALAVVVTRARAQALLPAGRMLAVRMSETQILDQLEPGQEVAAVNAPTLTVVAGSPDSIERLRVRLERGGVECVELASRHAFHTSAVDPSLAELEKALDRVSWGTATRRFVSSTTGKWAGDEVSTPAHWIEHARARVLFDDALVAAVSGQPSVVVELGPPAGLSSLAGRAVDSVAPRRHRVPLVSQHDLLATAALWASGVDVGPIPRRTKPRRAVLPGYPFTRTRHWVTPSAEHTLPVRLRHRLAGMPSTEAIDDHRGLRDGLERLCGLIARQFVSAHVDVLEEFEHFAEFLGIRARELALPAKSDAVTADALGADLTARFPGYGGLVELLLHCGRSYPEALSTPGVALGVLYPDGRGDLLERTLGLPVDCVGGTVAHRATGSMSLLVAHIVDEKIASRTDTVRVLEIGAGAGALTRVLSDEVTADFDLQVTDIAPGFVDAIRAEASRRGLKNVVTSIFDITEPPEAQGISTGYYDVVCGLDVIHATAHLTDTLHNVRSLLKPGGTLALVESVSDDSWTTMIWGLTREWWSARDTREHGPLRTVDGWRSVLADAGFAWTDVVEPAVGPRDAVLLVGEAPLEQKSAPVVRRSRSRVFDPAPAERNSTADPGAFCWSPGWRHAVPATRGGLSGSGLIVGAGSCAVALAARLTAAGFDVVRIERGSDLVGTTRTVHGENGGNPSWVVHLGALEASELGTREPQRAGLHDVFDLVKALLPAGTDNREHLRILAVTAAVFDVLGSEVSQPEFATMVAAAKVLPLEYPQLSCTILDVDGATDETRLIDAIVGELATAETDTTNSTRTVLALRGARLFVPDVRHSPLPTPVACENLAPGGVHVVLGGLGGIGLHLAAFLASLPATVVLVHKRPIPDRQSWSTLSPDHPRTEAIRRIQAIEAAGGQVELRQVDITDASLMRKLIESIVADHGPITGVVHAAGVPDTGGVLTRRTAVDTDSAMAAKVVGGQCLDAALDGNEPGYVLLCSSIGTLLYKIKFGEVGYVAGNEYLDALAAARSSRGARTVSVSWTDWEDSGMWAAAQSRLADRYVVSGKFDPTDDVLGAITPAQGVEIFRRILAGDVDGSRVVVCRRDLKQMLAFHDGFSSDDHAAAIEGLRAVGGAASENVSPVDPAFAIVADPPFASSIEETVAQWFRELLGVDVIGSNDGFFRLGGDSLLALRLLSYIRTRYEVSLSVTDVLAGQTVAAIAHAIVSNSDLEEVIL